MKVSGSVEPARLPAPVDTPAHTWHELSSDGHTWYRVRLYLDGRWACECRGFHYTGFCRHIGKVRLAFLHV